MSFNSYPLLKSIFTYFGRISVRRRQRWGAVLGWLTHKLASRRRHIVRTNLALCFPDESESTRRAWERQHFRLLAQSYLDRGLLWFGLPSTILNTLELTGEEHITHALEQGRRVMLLVPHFLGMDAAGTRLSMSISPLVAFYTPQRDPSVDKLMLEGRSRFSTVPLISRKDGIRGLMRALQKGQPIYYLPDMDFGIKGAAFVPFFNVPAATLLTTAQIARNQDAVVIPVISRLNAQSGHYQIQVLEPMADFPGQDSLEEATARMNALIEKYVRQDPTQYYWVHRRFKTRPEGQARIY
ncbi:MAG TPA: lysophospholipid acyltransferase family protein [Alcaligenes sp.]|nr:lysophospholipid acyltransferase family protein [Alcaligenes sp.]HRL27594.1 lysophospholipid acyltransferase family protein [Alcaligenes sp.]